MHDVRSEQCVGITCVKDNLKVSHTRVGYLRTEIIIFSPALLRIKLNKTHLTVYTSPKGKHTVLSTNTVIQFVTHVH